MKELASAVRRSMRLLDRTDQIKFGVVTGIQMLLSILDLAGVLLVGVVAALAVVSTDPSVALPTSAARALSYLGLTGTQPASVTLVLALVAAAFLVAKSVISVLLVRKVLRFLANRQAGVATRLASQIFSQPLTYVQKHPSQTTAYALMEGTLAAVVVLLGSFSISLADIALIAVLTSTLLLLDPLTTLAAIAFFLGIAFVLQHVLGSTARRAGSELRSATVAGLVAVQEGIAAYRELTVSNRRSLYADRIAVSMSKAARGSADTQFVAQVPKYVFETALVVGALAVIGAMSRDGNIAGAVSSMALFLAAGARVMPSLLRLQVSLISIRQAEARAEPTYALQDELHGLSASSITFDVVAFESGARSSQRGFTADVELTAVTYSYPDASNPAVCDVNLVLVPGSSLALVGSTGAGKSTLADLILGVVKPDSGQILIGGLSPRDAATMWPGAIAYVPQSVSLVSGTVRENIALGIPDTLIDDSRVWEALDRASLGDFLKRTRDGLDTQVGERGVRLSGGQRQRLGIARALYSRPLLLVLDEATSALDAETEATISDTLASLSGTVTMITVAHRLATVRSADIVVYLEGGRVAAQGSFEEVRRSNEAFNRQANLLGL